MKTRTIRLGLCCQFISAPIRFRTTTATYLQRLKSAGKDPLVQLSAIILSNAENLIQALSYCQEHRIGSFRINSQLFPAYTHPQVGYTLEELPEEEAIVHTLEKVKKFAQANAIRLTFHPDQFVVLNSPNPEVVERALADLDYHALMAELVGADVINIHAGGAYGDKKSALKRLGQAIDSLPAKTRQRLTLENDDKTYTPEDLIPLCQELKIPLTYDVHHHRCLSDTLSEEAAAERALLTWDREPLFHVSSPKGGWRAKRPALHADFIDPDDLPEHWRNYPNLTIDVEAKAKEHAVEALLLKLGEAGWPI